MTKQWIDNIETPISELELKVLNAVRCGSTTWREVAQVTGIKSAHCNNILTKLKNRGLIEKTWHAKDTVCVPASGLDEKRWLAQVLEIGFIEAIIPDRFRSIVSQIAFGLAPNYIPTRYISQGWICCECHELVHEYDGFAECGCFFGPSHGIHFADYDKYLNTWKRCTIHIIPNEL